MEYQYEKRIKNWLGGVINPINTSGLLTSWARKYIFELNDSKCSLCGWNKINLTTGKIPLEIDHIDGDYQNNKLENLRLLCPNCHSLSSNYKSLNKGKGRKNRKG
jgi:5-methylcytosine-specific restriction endonuclease McrA